MVVVVPNINLIWLFMGAVTENILYDLHVYCTIMNVYFIPGITGPKGTCGRQGRKKGEAERQETACCWRYVSSGQRQEWLDLNCKSLGITEFKVQNISWLIHKAPIFAHNYEIVSFQLYPTQNKLNKLKSDSV